MGDPTSYEAWPGFDGYYLQDSYVLAIRLAGDRVTFDLEAVLTPGHPNYRLPAPSEHHCYHRAELSFPNVRAFRFEDPLLIRPTTDPDGTTDLGNIDSLVDGPAGYVVEGDWGILVIGSDPPRIAVIE